MSKKIEFEYKDTKYILEYSRESIQMMEKSGFDFQEFMSKPALNLEIAFQGAFLKNHRRIKASEITEIYELLENKTELAQKLLEMIQETYDTLFDTKENKDGKNIEWKMV